MKFFELVSKIDDFETHCEIYDEWYGYSEDWLRSYLDTLWLH